MTHSLTELKLYLVDDDPICLSIMEAYLKELGYKKIVSFSNSADCLNQLTLRPDIIFLDYSMDNLNGIDILKKIRRFDPNLPVIFVSGQESIGVAVNALKYGAFDYLLKNELSQEKVKDTVEKVVRLRKIMASGRLSFFSRIFHSLGFMVLLMF